MTRAATYRLAAVVVGGCIGTVAACVVQPPRPQRSTAAHLYAVEVEAESDSLQQPPLQRGRIDSARAPRRTPGLPKRLESLTNTELVAYLNSLAYTIDTIGTQTANAPCVVGGENCPVGDSAQLLIQPEAGMTQVEHSAIPKFGLVVARVINFAPLGHDERDFGYRAQRKTWWVVDSSSGSLRSRFVVRTYHTTGPTVEVLGSLHPFVRCDHPDAPSWLPARAKFWRCSESARYLGAMSGARRYGRSGNEAARPSYFQLVSLHASLPLLPDAPLAAVASNWVTCGAGCCATSPY